MEIDESLIVDVVKSRAKKISKKLENAFKDLKDARIWVGGGCLTGGDVNDIDIFLPPTQNSLTFPSWMKIVSQTKNAVTYELLSGAQSSGGARC